MYTTPMAKITKKLINEVVQIIIDKTQPNKIILFGSYAHGNPTADSDLDLLVIKESDLRRDKRAMEIDKLFADRLFPLDIIVYTPQEVQQCLDIEGSFVGDILECGEIVYDKAS